MSYRAYRLAVTWTLRNHLFNMNADIYLKAFSLTPLAGAARPAVEASLSGPEEVDIFPSVVSSPTQVILYTISGGRRADLGRVPQQQHLWGVFGLWEVIPHAGIISVSDLLNYIIEFNALPRIGAIINPIGDVVWTFKCGSINLTFPYCDSESSTWDAHVWGPPAILLLIDFLQVEQMHKWYFTAQIQTWCLPRPLFVLDPTVSEETTLLSLLGCFFYPPDIRFSFLPGWCLFSFKLRPAWVSGGENTLKLMLSLSWGW